MTLPRLSLVFLLLCDTADAQTAYVLPSPILTPGAIDSTIGLSEICNGTTKHRRHVSPQTRAAVLSAYSVSDMQSVGMELDHLIPIALGGSNVAANLWPQPSPDYEVKDRLEIELQRQACVAYRTLTPEDSAKVLAQMQRDVAEDWVEAARKYGVAAP